MSFGKTITALKRIPCINKKRRHQINYCCPFKKHTYPQRKAKQKTVHSASKVYPTGGAGTNVQDDFSVDESSTDDEEKWMNQKWTQYKGYFDEVPEFNAIVTALAKWTVGKGFTGEEEITSKWRGNGL